MIGLTLLTLAQAAQAAPADPARGEGTDLARAQALFGKGEVHYRLGEFRQALTRYRQALRLAPRPNILFNIAQCHRQLGQRSKALFYYRLYLSDARRVHPSQPPPFEQEVREQITRLERQQQAAAASQPAASSQPAALPASSSQSTAEAPASAPVAAPVVAPPLAPSALSAPPAPPRRGLWLGLGISTAGLALAAEVAAIACTVEARDRYIDEPEFASFRDAAIASHVVAGVMAVASVVSWVIYLRLGSRGGGERAALQLRPGGLTGVF